MTLPVRSESASPSRRHLLAGALGGLAAWTAAAIDRVSPAGAAAGGPLIMGSTTNTAGTANTSLTTASTGTALLVTQNGTGTALRGSAVGAGSIAGFFTAANGTGISGVTGNPNSYGVFGSNDDAAAGTAGAIRAAGNNNHGLVATTAHANKDAVVATNTGALGSGTAIRASGGNCVGLVGTSDSRPGVIGTSNSDTGVFGVSGSGSGVSGESTSNYGVRGLSTAYTGVLGVSTSSVGVFGTSSSGPGVQGQSSSGPGVQGSSTTGYAGYFFGPVYVAGLLTKAGGGFRIDHPLDPANQYLQHSFVESPDMKNVYDGVVTLDARGEATVELPTYFETLNRDLRYQLTAVGAAAPDLHVKAKLAKGRFVIGGGSPGLEVCWQVTGIRQDPFAKEHPIVVEEAKSASVKGKYLHPELYGQPKTKAEHPSPDLRAPVAPIG